MDQLDFPHKLIEFDEYGTQYEAGRQLCTIQK